MLPPGPVRARRRGTVRVVRANRIEGSGSIDVNSVASAARRDSGGMLACYERALEQNPSIAGMVGVLFYIGPDGRPRNVSASQRTLNRSVTTCIERRVRQLSFPRPLSMAKIRSQATGRLGFPRSWSAGPAGATDQPARFGTCARRTPLRSPFAVVGHMRASRHDWLG